MRYVCIVILALLLAGGLMYAGLTLVDNVDETGVIGVEGRLLAAAVFALLLAVCTATAALVVLVFVIEKYLLIIVQALNIMHEKQVTYRSTDLLYDIAEQQLKQLAQLTQLARSLETDVKGIRKEIADY